MAFVDEVRVHPEVLAGDPFAAVAQDHPHACLYGYVYLGYTYVGVLTDYIVRGHDELLFRKTRGPLTELTP